MDRDLKPVKVREQRIDVNALEYMAYLDFIGAIRQSERTATELDEFEKAVVDAINELDRKIKG